MGSEAGGRRHWAGSNQGCSGWVQPGRVWDWREQSSSGFSAHAHTPAAS